MLDWTSATLQMLAEAVLHLGSSGEGCAGQPLTRARI